MPIVAGRFTVIELAAKLRRDTPHYTNKQAALAAIHSLDALVSLDGI